MITLPCHTTHTFHTLCVYYFKPFKIAFRKEINVDMARSKFKKLDKITFVRWVDKVLNQSLTKQNIEVQFRVIGIWSFKPKAMDEKTKSTNIYTTMNSNHGEGDHRYTSKDQASQSTRRGIIYSCKTI
jgi:hypothetical protein